MSDILPAGAEEITSDILRGLDQDKDDGTVYCNMDKPANNNNDNNINNNNNKTENEDKKPKDESEEDENGDELQFDLYDSEEDPCDDTNNTAMQQHLDSQKQSNDLVNNDTHITTATSTDDDSSGNKENITNNINIKEEEEEKEEKEKEEEEQEQEQETEGNNKVNNKQDVGSRTMEQWLNRDNLIVHPVWIGNLPRGTTVNQLRHFVESQVGRVLVSIHISIKQQNNERTYAFLNLPTAEKQLLAVTLLDGKIFTEEKLIVRPKRPSKFPQSFFGSSPISEHFKHFRDCVVPAILANPTINLNVTSVRKILEQNHINIDHLPNRVWCVQCTLVPQCHRTYCSFYHCHQEKELGRIISILAAQNCGDSSLTEDNAFNIEHKKMLETANNPNTIRSRHTLLIQGLPRSITSKKIEETFEVFGEIDNVIVNPDHTCYVRMKRSQDARKIVHLFKYNHAGVIVDFAPYGASKMTTLMKQNQNNTNNNTNNKTKNDNPAGVISNLPPLKHPNLINYATAPQQLLQQHNNRHHHHHHHHQQQQQHHMQQYRYNMNKPGLKPTQSDMLPITNPRYQQQQFGQHQQYAQNSQYQNNGMNNYAQYNNNNNNNNQHQQQQQQQQQNQIGQMNGINNNSPRIQNQRNKPKLQATQSEPTPNQSSYNQYQQQQRGYANNGGGYFANMTPQQYAEYYNKWQQQQQYQQSGYSQQQSQHQMYSASNYSHNNSGNHNGYGQSQQNQTQQNNSYYNNQQFNPYANSQNILSPIAQTPTNRQSQQQNNNNQNSQQIQQQQQQQSLNQRSSSSLSTQQRGGYGSARKQLGLRNAYSDVITTQQHQPMVANQLKQSPLSYDDTTTHQKYYYQQMPQQQQQQQQYTNNNNNNNGNNNNNNNSGYNMSTYDQMIQAHQRKNDQHKNWMQQQQQQTQRTRKVITAQPQQMRQTSTDGSLPNAPAIASIPEPDLHFQLSSHDFPLSPTSALHHTDNKQ